jgi:purine-nucleoside phosphorylase
LVHQSCEHRRVPNASESLEPFALAQQAAAEIQRRTGVERHDLCIVLGSGWATVAEQLGTGPEILLSELPGFPQPTAMGHANAVRSFERSGLRVLLFLGRIHGYEGHAPATVVHGVRTAAAAGCKLAILTNGAGYMQTDWSLGSPVLISDHINFTGKSPLTGTNPPAPFGSRFCDLTDLYSSELRDLVRRVDPTLAEGVYIGLNGPHFETPTEIRAFKQWGADLVGMSTVLEAIASRHVGMHTLGISLATNLAAGISPTPLSGEEVIAAGNAAAPRLVALLGGIIDQLAIEGVLAASAAVDSGTEKA